MFETVLLVVAVVEAVCIVVLATLLARSGFRVKSLQRQLVDNRERRWLMSGKGAVKAVWETANLVREKGLTRALRSSIEELAGWAQVERPDLAKLGSRDGTVTIFFSDIEGSTALNEELGDQAWVKLLSKHDKMIRSCVKHHRGHVVKTQGDGFMVAFARAEEAVRCGTDVQRALAHDGTWMQGFDIRVRIGIHTGAAVRRGDDLFGRNVALAARVAALADGGEVLVSDLTKEALADDTEFAFGSPRDVELKGLRGTHRVYPVEQSADVT